VVSKIIEKAKTMIAELVYDDGHWIPVDSPLDHNRNNDGTGFGFNKAYPMAQVEVTPSANLYDGKQGLAMRLYMDTCNLIITVKYNVQTSLVPIDEQHTERKELINDLSIQLREKFQVPFNRLHSITDKGYNVSMQIEYIGDEEILGTNTKSNKYTVMFKQTYRLKYQRRF
jgi:hypothetical protein